MFKNTCWTVVSPLALFLVLTVAFAQSGYHQIKKIPIPGDGNHVP